MALVRGDRLKPATRARVLAAFVHRNTVEHPFPASGGDGRQTDAEWLQRCAFKVNRDGSLDERVGHCFPAFMAAAKETAEEMAERRRNDDREAREAVKHAVRDWQRSCRVED